MSQRTTPRHLVPTGTCRPPPTRASLLPGREPRVRQVPVRHGPPGPVVPALLGPGATRQYTTQLLHRRPAVVQRAAQPRRSSSTPCRPWETAVLTPADDVDIAPCGHRRRGRGGKRAGRAAGRSPAPAGRPAAGVLLATCSSRCSPIVPLVLVGDAGLHRLGRSRLARSSIGAATTGPGSSETRDAPGLWLSLLLTALAWLVQTPLRLLLGVWAAGRQRNRAVLSAIFFLPLLLSAYRGVACCGSRCWTPTSACSPTGPALAFGTATCSASRRGLRRRGLRRAPGSSSRCTR